MYVHIHSCTHIIKVDGLTASCKTMHCTQHTFVYMLYYALYFCWYSMFDNDVSMAVKRNTADDI